MKIDRHNYEEYFILYMDNELNSGDRRQVEAFVELHPDLKEELDLLLQFKLVPDTDILFNGKDELMKMNEAAVQVGGDTPISLANYEEWFTLYTDHELTTGQKKTVEQFIAENPSLEKELALLQRTRLQPEEIVFTDKASLYRAEEKIRIIQVRWWRIAAAAILILGLGLTTYSILNKKSSAGTEEGVAKTNEQKTTPVETARPPEEQHSVVNQLAAENAVENVARANQARPPAEPVVTDQNRLVANDKRTNKPLPVKNNEPVVADNNTNNLPKPLYNPNINTTLPKTEVTIAANNSQKQIIRPDALTKDNVTTPSAQPSDIVTASFRDDAELNQPDGKKNKLRGFFRKVTRTFEKRTNIDATTDDDKLLVAGLAIKLR